VRGALARCSRLVPNNLPDCGNFIQNEGTSTGAADCNMPCKGDPSEICGAGQRLNVYNSGRPPPPMPSIVPSVGDWLSLGCYRSVESIIILLLRPSL